MPNKVLVPKKKLIAALVGWIIALTNFTVLSTGDMGSVHFLHASVGCTVMTLGLLQPLNALLRPHKQKGEARSATRLAWEVWHKASGYLALFFSIGTIGLGTSIIWVDNMEFRVSYAALWVIVLAAGVYLKCVADKRRFTEVPTDRSGADDAATAVPRVTEISQGEDSLSLGIVQYSSDL